MGILDFFFGKPDKFRTQSTLTPGQRGNLDQINQNLSDMQAPGGAYSGAMDFLKRLMSGDEEAFKAFEAPYLQKFNEQVLPGIAERFAGLNPMGGALSSSGFAQALGGAGAQLQADLAALRANLQRDAASQTLGQYNNLANVGLGTRAFESKYQPGNYGLLGEAAGGITGGFVNSPYLYKQIYKKVFG